MLKPVLALLLLSPLVLAAGIHPKDVGSAKVFIEVNWSVDFGSNLPPEFSLTSFAYPSNAWQDVSFESGAQGAFARSRDELGNELAKFTFSPQSRVENLSLRALADVNYLGGVESGSQGDFLSETPLTEATDEMRSQSASIIAGKDGVVARAAAISEWVHNRVSYDGFGYGATVENASWVYSKRLGTCDEFSHLFASLARTQGIPARFVAGFVCSSDCANSSNWGAHAWNEVYDGAAWVPFDPTFNEGVVLDATHVKFAHGRDQDDIREKLSATAFNYPIKDVKVTRSIRVSLDSFKPFGDLFDISISADNKTFGPGAVVPIAITAKNLYSAPLAVPVDVVAPKEVKLAPAGQSLTYLLPGNSVLISRNAILPDSLDAGYTYNYTISAVSIGAKPEVHVLARQGGDSDRLMQLRITEIVPSITGDRMVLKLSIENFGNEAARDATVSINSQFGNDTARFTLEAASKGEVEFSMPSNGSGVSGSITVRSGSYTLVQPFSVSVAPPANSSSFADPSQYAVYAAMAIVIILILAQFILQPR